MILKVSSLSSYGKSPLAQGAGFYSSPRRMSFVCFLFTNECRRQYLIQPLAEQAPSSPSVTGCKPGPLYPQQHFPAFLFLWRYLEERAPKPRDTSEVISSISSFTKEESEAQISLRFAAQDPRAA